MAKLPKRAKATAIGYTVNSKLRQYRLIAEQVKATTSWLLFPKEAAHATSFRQSCISL